jgi:hypothetical protein
VTGTIETGLYIDNAGGQYTQREICERLVQLGREVGAKLGRWPMGKYIDPQSEDYYMILDEVQTDLENKINDTLLQQGLILHLSEFEYVYLISKTEDLED